MTNCSCPAGAAGCYNNFDGSVNVTDSYAQNGIVVTCSAMDQSGNVNTCSETVKITAVPPTITCSTPAAVQCNEATSTKFSATVCISVCVCVHVFV